MAAAQAASQANYSRFSVEPRCQELKFLGDFNVQLRRLEELRGSNQLKK